ncbi:hypothetical protein HK405_013755, partial [Cladochytrium tenue]
MSDDAAAPHSPAAPTVPEAHPASGATGAAAATHADTPASAPAVDVQPTVPAATLTLVDDDIAAVVAATIGPKVTKGSTADGAGAADAGSHHGSTRQHHHGIYAPAGRPQLTRGKTAETLLSDLKYFHTS